MERQKNDISPELHRTNDSESYKNESGQAILFAQMQEEIDRLKQENLQLRQKNSYERNGAGRIKRKSTKCTKGKPAEKLTGIAHLESRRAYWHEELAKNPIPSHNFSNQSAEEDSHTRWWLKALGIAVASVVAVIFLFKSGLLIPLAIFGLISAGIIKVR